MIVTSCICNNLDRKVQKVLQSNLRNLEHLLKLFFKQIFTLTPQKQLNLFFEKLLP